jgi:hypothetical protein
MDTKEQIDSMVQDIRAKSSSIYEISPELTRTIIDGLVNTVEKATMRETPFREYFLPLFNNEIKDEHEKTRLLAKWVEYAGGMNYEVVITTDNDETELFTIPPINNTVSLSENNSEIYHLMNEYKLRSNRFHADGSNFMKNILENNIKLGVSTEHASFDKVREFFNNGGNTSSEVKEQEVSKAASMGMVINYDDD